MRLGQSCFSPISSHAGSDKPGAGHADDAQGGAEAGVLTRTKVEPKKPPLYKVLLLNDDYTPMEFVIHILERFFGKNKQEATDIMMTVHNRGVGVCGVYTYEVAEAKVSQVMDHCRKNEQPLQCTLEKE